MMKYPPADGKRRSIEPDTSRTVSFVATVNEDAYNTTIQNLATLTSDNTEPVQDKDDGVVVADGMTDLSINKSVDKSSARVGDTLPTRYKSPMVRVQSKYPRHGDAGCYPGWPDLPRQRHSGRLLNGISV